MREAPGSGFRLYRADLASDTLRSEEAPATLCVSVVGLLLASWLSAPVEVAGLARDPALRVGEGHVAAQLPSTVESLLRGLVPRTPGLHLAFHESGPSGPLEIRGRSPLHRLFDQDGRSARARPFPLKESHARRFCLRHHSTSTTETDLLPRWIPNAPRPGAFEARDCERLRLLAESWPTGSVLPRFFPASRLRGEPGGSVPSTPVSFSGVAGTVIPTAARQRGPRTRSRSRGSAATT